MMENSGKYSFRIPTAVSDLNEQPLYIIVASWAFRVNKLLTTEAITREFLLTQRRATDIMHYIVHEGARYIKSEQITLIKEKPQKIRYRALKIISITLPSLQPKVNTNRRLVYDSTAPKTSVTDKNIHMNYHKSLRRWMCIRKTGEDFGMFTKIISQSLPPEG
ncbi:CaiF/GrlA family transcriptional regulator [Escherichia coli]|nr:CaiF/GrlA family transcriptional regulator [Escherichia coli]